MGPSVRCDDDKGHLGRECGACTGKVHPLVRPNVDGGESGRIQDEIVGFAGPYEEIGAILGAKLDRSIDQIPAVVAPDGRAVGA